MLIIKCSKCRKKLFKYRKIGKGRVLRCWHSRIIQDFTIKEDDKVFCNCGNLIGSDDNLKVNMKQSAFIVSGTYE